MSGCHITQLLSSQPTICQNGALTHIQRGFLYIAVNSCGTKLAVMSALALARILLANGALRSNIRVLVCRVITGKYTERWNKFCKLYLSKHSIDVLLLPSQYQVYIVLGLISINLNLEDPNRMCEGGRTDQTINLAWSSLESYEV